MENQNNYLGDIILLPVGSAPRYFAACDGQILNINGNPGLYSLIGTTYGGDGKTTFALPDLRGRTPMGCPDGGQQVGEAGGHATVRLLPENLPEHTHTADTDFTVRMQFSTQPGDRDEPTQGSVLAAPPMITTREIKCYNTVEKATNVKLHPLQVSEDAAVPLSVAGGSTGLPNMQPFLGLGFYICIDGEFPSG